MAEKSAEKLFAEILKDYKSIAKDAVERAAIKTQEEMVKQAQSHVERYYMGYKPKWYRRKKNLSKAIVPIFKPDSTRRRISFIVGIEYDESKLAGLYKSNSWYHQSGDEWLSSGFSPSSIHGPTGKPHQDFNFNSQNNGIPDPGWILDNYLLGIHPWSGQGKIVYRPSFAMDGFIKYKLQKHIKTYVQEALFDALVSRLQKG